jgi:hypothetical protein
MQGTAAGPKLRCSFTVDRLKPRVKAGAWATFRMAEMLGDGSENVHSARGCNDVARPMPEVELRIDSSTPNEMKSEAGGVLDDIPFLRPSESAASRSTMDEETEGFMDTEGVKRPPSCAAASQQRKRTGSLRQTAMAKMRERIIITPPNISTTRRTPPESTPSHVSMHDDHSLDSSPERDSLPSSMGSLDQQEIKRTEQPTWPAPSSPTGLYVSTTDDDDSISTHRLSTSSIGSSPQHTGAVASTSAMRRRLSRAEPRAAKTASLPPDEIDEDEEDWDYSETEWWGWVILIATWVVFVVVMGSCFGVWSWAWDVGETPYAPPDLEDDDTLPITGYYPALMVCTAVMSWVWVVVAWMGMKFYRQ